MPSPYTIPKITCIGLANVDAVAHVDIDFLNKYGLQHGAASLLEPVLLEHLVYLLLPKSTYSAGGCAANTAHGLGLEGVPCQFIGKVGLDSDSKTFLDGFKEMGILVITPPSVALPTTVCLTLATPDKARNFAYNMSTAAWNLTESDLLAIPESVEILYMESYLHKMGSGLQTSALQFLCQHPSLSTKQKILNLADPVFTGVYRRDILSCAPMLEIIMGKKQEFLALLKCPEPNLKEALRTLHTTCIITDIGEPVDVICPYSNYQISVPNLTNEEIIDTIGYGDQFAAGFLSEWLESKDLIKSTENGIQKAVSLLKISGARFPRS